MQLGMIADDMAARHELFHQVRAFADELSDDEKCCFRFVVVEEIQDPRRDRGIWPVVKGDGQLARRVRPANRFAK